MVDPTPPVDPLTALSAAVIPASFPSAGLPPEAVLSLRRAFSREVRMRLPRLLAAGRAGGNLSVAGGHPDSTLRNDVVMLTEGTRLLGDVASVRALGRVLQLVDAQETTPDDAALSDAVDTVALLLGRWVPAA